MPVRSVTLPMVEEHIEAKSKKLVFPPSIEALYDEQMQSYRLKVMAKGLLPAVLIYNGFLVADLLLLPETLVTAAILHLCIVTPIILLIGFLYARVGKQWLRECIATTIPFMMIAQIMYIYRLNQGEAAADHYQYLAIMIVVYMNMNQRYGFRVAVASTALLASTYLAVLLPGTSPFAVKFTGVALMLSAAYLSLMANQRMERDVRHAFLRRLRDQLGREAAEEVANRDPLTGLANRRHLEEAVERLSVASEHGTFPAAVIMIDVDRFKPFNDRYGHVAGDVCLKRVAGAISAECRNEGDLVVRLGGEEFLMLLPDTDLSEAVRVAERIRRQIETLGMPNESLGPRGVVTASLGAMAGPASAQTFAELVSGADAALYAAKRNGRNQVWPPFVKKGGPVAALHQSDIARAAKQPRMRAR